MHKMIIDVDHMSIRALDRTLEIAEANAYPGIVASHVLMFELGEKSTRHERMRTKDQLQRIARVGGMIAAMTQPPEADGPRSIAPLNSKVVGDCMGSSTLWAWMYEYAVDVMTSTASSRRSHSAPISTASPSTTGRASATTDASAATVRRKISYPFTLDGFGTFSKQKTGKREFDFNTQGLAHVGLLPDMVEDLKKVGLANDLDPLFSSAEAYIRMWEKSERDDSAADQPVQRHDAPVTTVDPVAGGECQQLEQHGRHRVACRRPTQPAGSGVAEILHTIGGLSTVTAGARSISSPARRDRRPSTMRRAIWPVTRRS